MLLNLQEYDSGRNSSAIKDILKNSFAPNCIL